MDTQRNALMAAGAGFMIFILLLAAFMIICYWIVYSKAGQPGWAAIIPFYNLIILLKIVGRPVWWIVWFLQLTAFDVLFLTFPGAITGLWFFLSAVVCMVFTVIVTNGLSKSFGKSEGFTVGLILLPFIFYPILAFGDATCIGPDGIPPSSDDTQIENDNLPL